jgi:hypothetical protein
VPKEAPADKRPLPGLGRDLDVLQALDGGSHPSLP